MGKGKVNLTIDQELVEKAHKRGMNISAIAEKELYQRIYHNEALIEEPLKCEFCGKEGVKDNVDDVIQGIKRLNGLTWLYPDEKWICNHCLNIFSKNITK